MTTLERRHNWKISVFGREHGVPHVHVNGPDFAATVEIATGAVLAGSVPTAVLAEAREWLSGNREAAQTQWKVLNPTRERG